MDPTDYPLIGGTCAILGGGSTKEGAMAGCDGLGLL